MARTPSAAVRAVVRAFRSAVSVDDRQLSGAGARTALRVELHELAMHVARGTCGPLGGLADGEAVDPSVLDGGLGLGGAEPWRRVRRLVLVVLRDRLRVFR